jgi:Kef-type K+ transport system membrane component KefB
MVLGESDFRHHMESHLRPFRDVLSGVFFVTIGLQLDAAQILSAPLAVLAWLVVLVPVKILLNTLALRATRLSALDAWRTGIALGHGGEFALLLLGTVLQQHLIPATVVQPMLVALVLSMALAPLLIRHHDVLAVLEPHRRRHSATQAGRSRDRRADDAISRPCHRLRRGRAWPDSQRDSSPRRRGASAAGGGRAEGRGRACRRRAGVPWRCQSADTCWLPA